MSKPIWSTSPAAAIKKGLKMRKNPAEVAPVNEPYMDYSCAGSGATLEQPKNVMSNAEACSNAADCPEDSGSPEKAQEVRIPHLGVLARVLPCRVPSLVETQAGGLSMAARGSTVRRR